MDATGNGVLIFLAALVPILALGALLTDLLLANAPRRGKRPDVAAPAPADVVPAPRAAAPRNFPTPRTVLVFAHVALAVGSLVCARAGWGAWAIWLAVFAAIALVLVGRGVSAVSPLQRSPHAGQTKK